MNILVIAYNCSPSKGSECTVGWNWIYQYSINAKKEDFIYAVIHRSYRDEVEKALEYYNLDNVILWAPEIPNWIEKSLKEMRLSSYDLWLKHAYDFVRKQGISFDIIHHVSKTAMWFTGEFWKYNEAYTIFGPVGGGQEIPDSLREYQTNRVTEIVRTVVNRTRVLSPWYRRAIKAFDVVYAVNEETMGILSGIAGKKVKIEMDMATPNPFLGLSIADEDKKDKTHRFLFSGEYHTPRKGVMFLLDCLEYLPDDFDYTIDFIGGKNDNILLERIKELKLEDRIKFHGKLPYEQLKDIYIQYDAFVFTSLRETSGNVLAEAMASGLPIVGFNTSINKVLKKNGCGIFIEVENRSLEDIKRAFASAMIDVFSDYKYYSGNAYRFANTLTWNEKYKRIMNDYMSARAAT